jgi:DNA/RNA-binding domain of Phe-tRNA-synthetase-like protein
MNASKPLFFSVSPAVSELGVKVSCFLANGIDNVSESPEFTALFKSEIEKIRTGLSEDSIQSNPVLAGFRTLHEKIGKTGKRWTSSPENLKKMLLANSQIPNINKLVNIYNLVSLQSDLALGAHDVTNIEGDVSLRMTTGTEKFQPIGTKEPEKIAPGEYSYCDQGNEVICRLEVRQVEKTKIHPHTKDAFLIVQGNPQTSDDTIGQTSQHLAELIKRYTGGVCTWL